jgi:hypothetical protein
MVRFTHLAGITLILALSACTYTLTVPQPTFTNAAASAEQPDSVVALVIKADLRTAKWSETMMGDTYEAPLGDALTAGAKQMLLGMFKTVETVQTPGGLPTAVYYVTPTMQRIEHTRGLWAWNDQVFTMAVEWRVTDQAGQTVLLDTIISEGRGPQGNGFTIRSETRDALGRLMNDTFTKARARLEPVLRHKA